jgi:hypothetical protein
MKYSYNKLLNKEFYNKCISRNINKVNLIDNFTNLTVDIDAQSTLFYKKVDKAKLSNQNNKSLLISILNAKITNSLNESILGNKFQKNTKLRYSFLVKPTQNGFLYYTPQSFGFFSKNFLKGFTIIIKKKLLKTNSLSNKIFLCNLHKNQNFIISKLKVLSSNIKFFMKFDKRLKKNQIFINQKFVLPIKIKYAKNKNKKTNQNNYKYNRKKENFNTKVFVSTKNPYREIYKQNNIKFNIK